MDNNDFMFLTLFTLAVALTANLLWRLMTTTWTRRTSLTATSATQVMNDMMDNYAQTNEDRPLLTLVEGERKS